MREQNVEFPVNGQSGAGFLVRPDTEAAAPGVVVIQEWWGVDAHIRDITRRFATQGYVALAPDLYHGRTVAVTEPNDAQKEAMALDRPRAIKEIASAATYLNSLDYVQPKKIGVVGFCMGGGLALHTAAHSTDLGAVVAFYGGGAPEITALAHNKAAILDICGTLDNRVTETIQRLDVGMRAFGFPHELIIYPGAEHAFFNDTRKEVYNPDAAQDAWNRALNWFKKYLV